MKRKAGLLFLIFAISWGLPLNPLQYLRCTPTMSFTSGVVKRTSTHVSDITDWRPPHSKKILYIAPVHGMGNLLQTIASALTVAKREKFDLRLVLQPQAFGTLTWGDLFLEPSLDAINGTFPDGAVMPIDTKSCEVQGRFMNWASIKKKWKSIGDHQILCATTCCWKEKPFPQSVHWFYKKLTPSRRIQTIVRKLKHKWEWPKFIWVGVHLRKSDNLKDLKHYFKVPDDADALPAESYISLMKLTKDFIPHTKGHWNMKSVRFFLATDNQDMRDQVMESFPADQVVEFPKEDDDELRDSDTGIQSSVVDLFLLAACDALIGTPHSSYSATAQYMSNGIFLTPGIAHAGPQSKWHE